MPKIKITCNHESVTPKYTDNQLKNDSHLDEFEFRKKYPRFDGTCPDCGSKLIAYSSTYHYLAGDW